MNLREGGLSGAGSRLPGPKRAASGPHGAKKTPPKRAKEAFFLVGGAFS